MSSNKTNHMKKLLLLTLISAAITTVAKAQTAKAVYGEFGGNGLVFSANFDTRFSGEKGIGGRVGVGYAAAGGVSIVTFPVAVNYLVGGAPHYLEIGAGVTFVTASVRFFDDDESETGTGTFFMPTLGYRYAKQGKGFIGRIYVGPVIAGGTAFFPWGGISAGFKF